jgi:integrase
LPHLFIVVPNGSFGFPFGGDWVATKLTKRTLDALEPREKQFTEFDTDIKGFGVRVMPSGARSFIVEYRPGAGGRNVAKRRLTLGRYGAMTVDQARTAALNALARIRLGSDPAGEKNRQRASPTVADLIGLFTAEHVDAKLKAGTAQGYKIALEKLRGAHGSIKASQLTRAQVAALHAQMRGNPYGANRFLAITSKLYSWASDRGSLPEGHANPAARIGRYKEESRERFLTSGELARLGDVLREAETIGLSWTVDEKKPAAKHLAKPENRRTPIDPFMIAAIRLLILTGARLREILHARWEHVDFERGILFLPDSKTGKKPIFLNAAALAVLADLPRIAGNIHVIPGGKQGQPRHDLKKPWAAVCKAADLQGLRIHDLRHSFASVGAGASMGLPIIGRLLGHSQAATTQRYAHLTDTPMRASASATSRFTSTIWAILTQVASMPARRSRRRCASLRRPPKYTSSGLPSRPRKLTYGICRHARQNRATAAPKALAPSASSWTLSRQPFNRAGGDRATFAT